MQITHIVNVQLCETIALELSNTQSVYFIQTL